MILPDVSAILLMMNVKPAISKSAAPIAPRPLPREERSMAPSSERGLTRILIAEAIITMDTPALTSPLVSILVNALAVIVKPANVAATAARPLIRSPVSIDPSSLTGLTNRFIATAIKISPSPVFFNAFGVIFMRSNTRQKAVSSPRITPIPSKPFPISSTSLSCLTALASIVTAIAIAMMPSV